MPETYSRLACERFVEAVAVDADLQGGEEQRGDDQEGQAADDYPSQPAPGGSGRMLLALFHSTALLVPTLISRLTPRLGRSSFSRFGGQVFP